MLFSSTYLKQKPFQKTEPEFEMTKTIMHVDLDAFFASVEEREHPEYLGKAVIVGADTKGGRGVVSTANYLARKSGVHSAMPISQAHKILPDAVFVMPDFKIYRAASENVMNILRTFSNKVESVSIDEAYVDVSELAEENVNGRELAQKVKREIEVKERLTCSIGIGSNKLIAKIASDFNKPSGLTVVKIGDEKSLLDPLSVRKIPYVGPKTESRLKKEGIITIGSLATVKEEKLLRDFGNFGRYLYESARGMGSSEVIENKGNSKSINRNVTLTQDSSDRVELESLMDRMASDVHASMAEKGIRCRTIGVRVRFSDFDTVARSKTIKEPARNVEAIKVVARDLLSSFYNDRRKVRQVGIKVSNFGEDVCNQKRIFDFG